MSQEAWILEGARTPMCRYVGHFAGVSAIELGALAAKGALERSGVDPTHVDHVIVGNRGRSFSFKEMLGLRGLPSGKAKATPKRPTKRVGPA